MPFQVSSQRCKELQLGLGGREAEEPQRGAEVGAAAAHGRDCSRKQTLTATVAGPHAAGLRGLTQAGRVEMMLAGFLILVCGLAALLYLISKRRSMPPLEPEQEREKYRYLRDHSSP
jgi:hypothetical protein